LHHVRWRLSVFRAYIRQKWANLRQSKTKMIIGPLYTSEYISPA